MPSSEESYESLTRVTPAVVNRPDDEFRYHTEDARTAVLYIRTLPDVTLLAAARHELESSDWPTEFGPGGQRKPVMMRSAFRTVLDEVDARASSGGPTNPEWLTGAAAIEAYERGLIGEDELDRIEW